ncbi:branchpoint-bridging protein [Histomonas meleagridis]|uniref:branchpoint-bridging protein n=1 Tax=Histomonas meleagridis TaxID=135588 RepID=UPI003559430D|nr:branchpoint-bridging protein [Histomonas meleagridis]KAH0798836.1 branchpoint-bridging protein [Histomonas meleagridis]
MCQKTGDIIEANLFMNKDGLSKGFGYAIYSSEEKANAAMKILTEEEFDGRRLHIQLEKKSTPKPEQQQPKKSTPPETPPQRYSSSHYRSQIDDHDRKRYQSANRPIGYDDPYRRRDIPRRSIAPDQNDRYRPHNSRH